jgi:hypothetical protein
MRGLQERIHRIECDLNVYVITCVPKAVRDKGKQRIMTQTGSVSSSTLKRVFCPLTFASI